MQLLISLHLLNYLTLLTEQFQEQSQKSFLHILRNLNLIFCYNHNSFTAFIVFTLINAIYAFIGLCFSVSGLTKIRLILLILLIAELVLTILLTCGIHTDTAWMKIMLGLDIGSIFVGSVFSIYVCCAIHELHYTSIG